MTGSPEPRGGGLPRLHLVTNDALLRSPGFLHAAERLLKEGGGRVAIHLRGHELSGREMWDRGSRVAEIASDTGGWLIVNDRVDVAAGCGAHGVQLGHESIPPAAARRILGGAGRVGVSVHSLGEAAAAAEWGADYLLAGTLFRSPTHPGGTPTGVAWLPEAAALGIPLIGIGGVDVARVREVVAAGAHGVAVISAVWDAPDPAGAVRTLLEELERP